MGHEKYQISIERDGRMVPVGLISGESYRTATFSYIEEYLDDRNAVPVSMNTWLTEMHYRFPSVFLYSGKAFRRNRPGGFLKDFFRKGSPEDP